MSSGSLDLVFTIVTVAIAFGVYDTSVVGASRSSSSNETCTTSVNESHALSQCCSGYEAPECKDENECEALNGGCSHNCVNTNGSYYCTCPTGYNLTDDGHTCQDGNECKVQNGGCSHECVNTNGSYYCKCASGYNLTDDGHRCQDFPECSTGQALCSHNCTELSGSYNCSCYDGYSLDKNGYSCNAICESGCFHGDCIAPDNCTCDVGWKGFTCNKALCQPGTYSDSGFEPCEKCPTYSYQLNYGSSYCDPCDNLTISKEEVCLISTDTSAEVLYNTIIVSAIGGIVIAIFVLFLVTTAVACTWRTKHKKTLQGQNQKGLEVNIYDDGDKEISLDGEEKLVIEQPKGDSSTCIPSPVMKASQYHTTIDEIHNSALIPLDENVVHPNPLLLASTQPPLFAPNPLLILPSSQPPCSTAKQPSNPPENAIFSETSVFPSYNQSGLQKDYINVTTSSSFENEGVQTLPTKSEHSTLNFPSMSNSSRLIHESESSRAHSSKFSPQKEPMMPTKSPPESTVKPCPALDSKHHPKISSSPKSLIHRNKGGTFNSSEIEAKNQASFAKNFPELTSDSQPESSSPHAKVFTFNADMYENIHSEPHSTTLIPMQESSIMSKPTSERSPSPSPDVSSVQPSPMSPSLPVLDAKENPEQLPKVFFLDLSLPLSDEQLPKIPGSQELKDNNSARKLSSVFVHPVHYSSSNEPNLKTAIHQKSLTLQKPKLPKKPSLELLSKKFPKLQSSICSPVFSLSSDVDEVDQHNHKAITVASGSLKGLVLKKKEASVEESYSTPPNPTIQNTLPKPKLPPKPQFRLPQDRVLKIQSNGLSPEASQSSSVNTTNHQHRTATTLPRCSLDFPTKLSPSLHSPLYISSATEPHSGVLTSCKQKLAPKPKPRKQPTPSYDVALTQLPNRLTSENGSESSLSQSACQGDQQDQISDDYSSFFKDTNKPEKDQENSSKLFSEFATNFEPPFPKESGEKSLSTANTANELTVPQGQEAKMPPKPTPIPRLKKLPNPKTQVLPIIASTFSPTDTQTHLQDPQLPVEVYLEPFPSSQTLNQQAPSSKGDGYSNSDLVSHEYEDVDDQMHQGEKSLSSGSIDHQVTMPQRKKTNIPPKPATNPSLKVLTNPRKKTLPSMTTQNHTQKPQLLAQVDDKPYPCSSTHNQQAPLSRRDGYPNADLVCHDYEVMNSPRKHGAKSHFGANNAHQLTVLQRQKVKMPSKPTANPPPKQLSNPQDKPLPSITSSVLPPTTQHHAQAPHILDGNYDHLLPFSRN